MSSTLSDSEMSFDSEGSEIYYTAEVETEESDESRFSTSQTSSDGDQAELYADDPLGWPTKNAQVRKMHFQWFSGWNTNNNR